MGKGQGTEEDREGVLHRRIAALERDLALMTTRQHSNTSTARQTRATATSRTTTPTMTTTSSIASSFFSVNGTATRSSGRAGSAGSAGGGGSLSRPARSVTPPVQRGRAFERLGLGSGSGSGSGGRSRGTTPTSSVYGSGGSAGSAGRGGFGYSGGSSRAPPRHLSPSPTAMARTNTHTSSAGQPRRSTSSAGSSHSNSYSHRPPTPPRQPTCLPTYLYRPAAVQHTLLIRLLSSLPLFSHN